MIGHDSYATESLVSVCIAHADRILKLTIKGHCALLELFLVIPHDLHSSCYAM